MNTITLTCPACGAALAYAAADFPALQRAASTPGAIITWTCPKCGAVNDKQTK